MKIDLKKPIKTRISRDRMCAYKRSINYILSLTPKTVSSTLNSVFPSASNLLEAIYLYEKSLPLFHPFRQAREDIIQYDRMHKDVASFQQLLGVSDDFVDQLFLSAMEYEGIETFVE